MNCFKKITLVVLCFLLVFSNLVVFASPKDDFEAAMNKDILKAKLKMEISIEVKELSDDILKLLEIESNIGKITLDYDVIMNMSEDYKKLSMSMNIQMKFPISFGVPLTSIESYIDMDLSNTQSPKMIVITKIPNQEKYIYLDYTKIPGFEQILKTFDLYSPNKVKELNKLFFANLTDSNFKFDNNEYTLTLSESELKELFKNYMVSSMEMYMPLYSQLSSIPASGNQAIDLSPDEMKAQLENLVNMFSEIKLFAKEAVVSKVSLDSNKEIDKMSIFLNIDTNIYDVVTTLAPNFKMSQEELDSFKEEITKENSNIKINLSVLYDFDDVNGDVKVVLPILTADNSIDGTTSLSLPNTEEINVFYNNLPIIFDDAKPIVLNDRTLVPLRKLCNTLGISDDNIKYENGVITIVNGDSTMVLTVDQKNVVITKGNDKFEIELDVPATVINNRTLVPLRFISENFNCKVNYQAIEGSNGAIIEIMPL